MPRSHNNSPRPMTSSCFASSLVCQDNEMRGQWFLAAFGGTPWPICRSLLRQDAYAASQGSLPTACRFYCEQRLHVSAGCNREPCGYIASAIFRSGEVAEWLKAHAWKACIRETVSWVRIPPSPPNLIEIVSVFQIIVDRTPDRTPGWNSL